ncbi:MAG TPA: hypothetical protein VN611_13485 [Patescibacteria group bacterium]|nr:hypothetical protein [Patescibacteria group bacterium]
MEYVIILVVLLKSHPIFSFFVLFGGGLVGLAVMALTNRGKFVAFGAAFIFTVYFGSLFMGHFVSNYLLEQYGERGEAMMVDISPTADSYNDQVVLRYDVMIQSPNRQPLSTHCLSSDFNIVHPESSNHYVYPGTGVKFNVWFLPEYPRAFTIIANDDSAYSQGLRRGKEAKEINRLTNQLKMDPQNTDLIEKLNQAQERQKNNK